MAVCERFQHGEIEALRTGRFGNKVNTACIVYRLGGTVIDTGPPNRWATVRRFLAERDVRKLLITHHHEDHGGNAARIKNQWDAEVFVHDRGVHHYTKGFFVPPYRAIVWGRPKGRFEPQIFDERIELENGVMLQSIHCPGHAIDQCAFLEPNRGWLFSGDVFIARRPKCTRRIENPNEEITSLERLLKHDFDKVFCAHRGVIEDGYQAIRDKYDYLVDLREQAREGYRKGEDLKSLTRKLMGSEDLLFYISFGDFSKRNLVGKLGGYRD